MKIVAMTENLLIESIPMFIHEYSEEKDHIWTEKITREYLQINLESNPEYCFAAVDDDNKLIGVIFCRLDSYYSGKLVFIDWLQVDEKYRNKGVATELVRKVVFLAKQNNIQGIHMYVDSRKELAKKWYERIGFVETGWVEYEVPIEKIII